MNHFFAAGDWVNFHPAVSEYLNKWGTVRFSGNRAKREGVENIREDIKFEVPKLWTVVKSNEFGQDYRASESRRLKV